jgi:hypothetical protein
VASLISLSIQDIQQNPQDTSNFYLANIYYQSIADPNRTNTSSSLPGSPPSFSPPTYAIWVNTLWFLSLVISLTCALIATLLQQWARRYLKVTQTRSTPHKQARMRSFFAEGVEKSLLPSVVEALPMLIHVSLFLFFAGLVVFVWNVHLTIFKFVLSWVSICTTLYGCIILIPVFRHNSPYYTPLTALARLVLPLIIHGLLVLYSIFYDLFRCCWSCSLYSRCLGPIRRLDYLGVRLDRVRRRTLLTPEKAALKLSSEIDTRAVMWTFDRLDGDHELERFFSGLPGFHDSKVVDEPLRGLSDKRKVQLLTAMIGFLDRTHSSDVLPDRVKHRRSDICANAIDLVDTPEAFSQFLHRLASEDQYGPLQSTEIVGFINLWGDLKDGDSTDQELFCSAFVRSRQHDDAWFNFASNELGKPESTLRDYAAHGVDLSFAILIYMARQQFTQFRNPSWPSAKMSDVLWAAARFKASDSSPELQHEFCALWNEIVRDAQNNGDDFMAERILNRLRRVYITLHRHTESAPTRFSSSTNARSTILSDPFSYPLCTVASNRLLDDSAPAVATPSPVPPPDPDAPSLSVPTPLRGYFDDSPPTVPPLDGSQPTHQIVDSLRLPLTSSDPVAAAQIQDIVASGITMPYPTPETSSSTSPFAVVSLAHDADPLMPSDAPKPPSSPPCAPIPGNIVPAGASLSPHSI